MRSARWATTAVGSVACALAVALAICGCAARAPEVGAPDPGLRGQWVLIGASDGSGRIDLLGQNITLTIGDGTTSSGRGSCSDYTATIYGSERSLWMKSIVVPLGFSCTTTAQRALQRHYLDDLRSVSRSAVTPAGLELSGPDVDLRFARASRAPVSQLVNKTWQLNARANLTLGGAFTLAPEAGGFLTFDSATTLTGVTKCVSYSADYAEVAGEIVPRNIQAIDRINCLRSTDKASRDFTRILGGGFSVALTGNSAILKSPRAGLTLGFNYLGGIDVPTDVTGTWTLVSGTDSTGPITPGTAPVTFTFNGANSGGRGPCNSFGATATATTTGSIDIRIGIHTNMACLDPELVSTESRYFAALDAVTTAALQGDTLTLTGQAVSLTFRRSTP